MHLEEACGHVLTDRSLLKGKVFASLQKGKRLEDSLLAPTHSVSFLNLDVMLYTEEEKGLVLDGTTEQVNLPPDLFRREK